MGKCNEETNENTVLAIGKFTILWATFEKEKCKNNCNFTAINKFCKGYKKKLQKDLRLLNKAFEYRKLFFKMKSDIYLTNQLSMNGSKPISENCKKIMKDFLDMKGENLLCGALLCIYRIRNNLMHGLKCLSELNGQVHLFQSMNNFLGKVI